MLSKKHYKAIAEIIFRCPGSWEGNTRTLNESELITRLGDYFRRDNPSFDRNRFERACIDGIVIR